MSLATFIWRLTTWKKPVNYRQKRSPCVMYLGIIDLIRKCDHQRVAFVVGTLLGGVMLLGESAQAADEAAIRRLIETNECVGCDLHDADLRRLDLSGANLAGADLEGANFYYANLDGAQLQNANLIDVNLGYASLQNAFLDGADLRYAIFDHTNLSGASMIEADLREAYIDEPILVRTILNGADLRDTLVFDVDFSKASLCGVLTWAGIEYRSGCYVTVPDQIDN
ncbi:MAG: pentapeptide repeat-containing protein [Cyanobacteria bacterium J06649_4]